MNIWAAIIPLILFALLDTIHSPKLGIWAAIIFSFGFFGYDAYQSGTIDWTLFIEPLIIAIFGFASIYVGKLGLFRYQTAFFGVVLGVIILVFQFAGMPILIRYWNVIVRNMNAQQLNQMQQSNIEIHLGTLSLVFGIEILMHGAMMYFVAKNMKNLAWVLGRISVYPLLLISGSIILLFT